MLSVRMTRMTFLLLATSLALLRLLVRGQEPDERPVEYPPYDGWYNNYAHPSWGGADTQLFRKVPPAYSDGSYEPAGQDRPSPMNLSRVVFTGPTGFKSYKNRTALMVFFGQQVVEEILDAQRAGCPPEYFNMDIPKEHEHYSDQPGAVNVLPVLRTRYDMRTGTSPNNPRQQLNEISAWIDGTLVYGPNKAWTDAIRAFKDGLLQTDDVKGPYGGEFPRNNTIRLPFINPPPPRDHPHLKPVARFNKIGNPRGNENPFLLTMGIIWFRYHNWWARRLKTDHPKWSDEKLFNEARKMVVGIYQHIVTEEWLPQWLGEDLDPYEGYDPTVHPGVAHVFQSAAMRFGHTMVPPGVYRRDKHCNYKNTTERTHFKDKVAIRTCNSFWNPQEAVYETDIDELIMGMASQVAEREDNIITPDLRGNVFGSLEFNRRDLMAINIQRARDHGIPDFNTVRKAYNLPPKTWTSLIVHSDIDLEIVGHLKDMYKEDFSKLDLWVGGMLEVDERPGETFRAIIKDQFQRIRDGDRFWYANRMNGLYTEDEINVINTTTFKDVIISTTTINANDIQDNPFIYNGYPCPPPFGQLNHSNGLMEDCTEKKTFDYFSGSEISYVLSLVVLFATFFIFVGILLLLAKQHNKQVEVERKKVRQMSKRRTEKDGNTSNPIFTVSEWLGPKEKWHNVKVKLDKQKKQILVYNISNRILRTVDLKCMLKQNIRNIDTYLSNDKKMDLLIIKIPKEYDLVLRFDSVNERQAFLDSFKNFLGGEPAMTSPRGISTKQIYIQAVSKEYRRKQLENFFKAIVAHIANDSDAEAWKHFNRHQIQEILNSELTKTEFAEVLGLTPNSMFLESMFKMADIDRSGSLSFREFLDIMVIFYKGDAEKKMKLLFNMYDVDKTGQLSRSQFVDMFRSLVDLSSSQASDFDIEGLVQSLCDKAGVRDRNVITYEDFSRILQDYERDLDYAVLDFDLSSTKMIKNAMRKSAGFKAREAISSSYGIVDDSESKRLSMLPSAEVKTLQKEYPKGQVASFINAAKNYIENYKLHIFWITLYTLVCIGIFVERAYYYSVEREHSGLRRIAGDGVTVTRGAASGMMFTYGCLLVTMCRNLITALRETFLNYYIPFDAAVDFHKYISLLALIFTLLHIVGHCINFYHVSTQTADDLSCLFRDFYHATDELPKFHEWLWLTITGFTGVLLTIQMFMIYIFAIQYARRHSFRSFWITHNSYFIFFALMFFHGMGRLVQPPFCHYFMLGPIILFTVDRLISVSRKKIEISVVRAELLPSDVTYLEIKRPANFDYKSGQWVRIACTAQGKNEYHPFTLSSAPHEENLGVHIRGVGPWTYQLRNTYNPDVIKNKRWPTIFLDGPYGEGHQDWYKFEVAVMVGGGIGVTPFTSILKDIAHKSKTGSKILCKKVYFIWVTRTQRQFEWVTDIIRAVEAADEKGIVAVHIFITAYKQKFDIRTTMLYICEKYFQKVHGRSLLTGLSSITHFGRPDFYSFLSIVARQHKNVNTFGVFSCGPPPMTSSVEKACRQITNLSNVLFIHHYENF